MRLPSSYCSRKGADIESKDTTARRRYLSAQFGHEAIVQLLLQKGADIESKSKFGQTPLSWLPRTVIRLCPATTRERC